MDQRRFVVFFSLSMLVLIGWYQFVVPALLPPPPPKPIKLPSDTPAEEPAAEAAKLEIPEHPVRSLWLGPEKSADDAARTEKFVLAAKFRSEGASIEAIELTDRAQYPEFGHRENRARLVGALSPILKPADRRTFGLTVPSIDKRLKDTSLDRIPWEVANETADSVTFRIVSPDGVWEILKKFELRPLTEKELETPGIRETLADAYKVNLTVTLKNLSESPHEISYTLQGPSGVPLEDPDNTYKYRDIRMGFLRDDGSAVDESRMAASEVVSKDKAKTPVIWKRPLQYIGVDVAYFAALILPGQDQVSKRTINSASPIVAEADPNHSQYSDISVDLVSEAVTVPAGKSIEHSYALFAGPKRQQLLEQVYASAVLDYGWFDSICRGMVRVLNLFHSMGLSYGLAIICLTVVVRTLLIPLSKHQAAHAARMKELQPRIQAKQKELEARHGKNTKEYLEASQELVAEQSKMMLGGCLPMLLQLPIFIALYRSLSSSIELRMEPFLWFENLASPDALFQLPFRIPVVGWTEFNLLPCISIGLMMVHQKLTMPPPQTEEQRAQYKMMNIMMFVMGATFYRVPAGLCLYFIATNVWSMTERSIFERKARAAALNPPEPAAVTAANGETAKPSAWKEWLKRLQESADKNVSIRNERPARDGNDDGDGKGRKRGKR